jgi:anaerobic magnesium-protoporphyrin IX monomethyl ester cyclase
MRVMLVNPPRFEGMSVIREERCEIIERYSVLEPYSLLQLAAIIRERNHDVSLIDANGFDLGYEEVLRRIKEFGPEMVIFRFTPTTFDHDTELCRLVKQLDMNIKTVGLCWTLTTVPIEVMESVKALDYYILGEYEVVVPDLIGNWPNGVPGMVQRGPDGVKVHPPSVESVASLDELPLPAYDMLGSMKPYFINTPTKECFTIMYTSRGCPFNCTFCTVAGTPWKFRSAGSVIKELRFLKKEYNIKLISFFDETFTVDRQRTLDICRSIVKDDIDIKWYCNTRANLLDEELIRTMASAGCRGISLGIESGSQKILDTVSKGIDLEEARTVINLCKKNGIKVLCSFIIGLPGETWSTVEETIKFVKSSLPTGVQFNVAVPYPGTRLYEQALNKGLLEKTDWRRMYQHESIVGTDEMTPEDLNKARFMAYKALYTYPVWYMENIRHVLQNPDDFGMAVRYSIKIINNFLIHGMEHSH